MNNNSIVVHGPQGCGKTLYAGKLAAHFGLLHVVDDPFSHTVLKVKPTGTLYLTNEPASFENSGLHMVAFADLKGIL